MSRDMVRETVPRIDRRVGDNVIAGSNNSALILGRDRVAGVSTGYGSADHPDGGKGAGSLHAVVGRKGEDPSVQEDAASIYLSEKSDPDEITPGPGTKRTASSCVIARGDCMRLSARQDIKLSVGKAYIIMDRDGRITIEGDISLEESASQSIMRGEAFSAFWNTVRVPTPAGLSGPLPPIPSSVFTARSKVK